MREAKCGTCGSNQPTVLLGNCFLRDNRDGTIIDAFHRDECPCVTRQVEGCEQCHCKPEAENRCFACVWPGHDKSSECPNCLSRNPDRMIWYPRDPKHTAFGCRPKNHHEFHDKSPAKAGGEG
jgi:hypothetical protein